MQFKTFNDSKTTLAQICLPHQANSSGNIHGGEMMKMMDSAAGVAAMKYAGTNVVTARVDELCFKLPVHIGELVTCRANVVYAGKSSMETFVTVEAENPQQGTRKIALTAFFTMAKRIVRVVCPKEITMRGTVEFFCRFCRTDNVP